MTDTSKHHVVPGGRSPSKCALLLGDLKVNGLPFSIILFLQFLAYAVFGTENSLVPLMASKDFHVPGTSKTLVVLVMYGIFKAVAGLVVPFGNNLIGRHNVHRLGWILFIPNPFMIWYASNWETVIGAYAFLGFSQGLCSCTNNQFVQQLIPNSQGFATGIYETVSYISLAIFSLIAATIVQDTGKNRPGPQQLALGLTLLALIVTIVMPRQNDLKEQAQDKAHIGGAKKKAWRVFAETTLLRRVPAMSCLAGVMIQVAVGLAWTLLPLYWKSLGLNDPVSSTAITQTFNAIRGVVQLFSGTLSDFLGARIVVVLGFCLCGLAFILSAAIPNNYQDMTMSNMVRLWIGCSAILGLGVGGVYPVMPAQVGKTVASQDRDMAVSTFRFWRELGYALGGGISVTILTEQSVATCVIIIGALLLGTALILAIFYGPEKAAVVNKAPEEQGLSPRGHEGEIDTERGH